MPQALPVIDDRPLSADRVPTLTEVVELDLPVPRPGRVDDGEHHATPVEAAGAEAAPAPAPAQGEPAALAAPDPSTDPVPDAEPQAMADDFVLAGLEEDAVVERAPAAAGREFQDAAADMAPSAIEGPLPQEAEVVSDGVPVEAPARQEMVTADAAGSEAPPAVEPPASEPGPVPAPEPPPVPTAVPAALPVPLADVDAVVGQVLSELTPRIDMLLESRLREALAPALARAADGLIRDTRANLAVAVRELVQEAVDRALQRRTDL
jgi:hypothetical protein